MSSKANATTIRTTTAVQPSTTISTVSLTPDPVTSIVTVLAEPSTQTVTSVQQSTVQTTVTTSITPSTSTTPETTVHPSTSAVIVSVGPSSVQVQITSVQVVTTQAPLTKAVVASSAFLISTPSASASVATSDATNAPSNVGQIFAIGAGALAGAILLMTLGVWLLRLRKNKKSNTLQGLDWNHPSSDRSQHLADLAPLPTRQRDKPALTINTDVQYYEQEQLAPFGQTLQYAYPVAPASPYTQTELEHQYDPALYHQGYYDQSGYYYQYPSMSKQDVQPVEESQSVSSDAGLIP
ncbi:hypothetical protein EDD86DRAFT_80515 [Gorgonomyces haynaldii]|nr:hypothetical protein EDD86DRAFT_80515 [Gorgonomyces haynaldii]